VSFIDCIAITDTSINVNPCEEHFIMPNVFSPNKDRINELFLPIKYNCLELKKLSIFNRWGQKIYESSDKLEWDGKTNEGENVNEGAFYWVVILKKKNNKVIYKKGVVYVFI
jgi:gliding motility-associated-like protein